MDRNKDKNELYDEKDMTRRAYYALGYSGGFGNLIPKAEQCTNQVKYHLVGCWRDTRHILWLYAMQVKLVHYTVNINFPHFILETIEIGLGKI